MALKLSIQCKARMLVLLLIPLCIFATFAADLTLGYYAQALSAKGGWRETKKWKQTLLKTQPTPEIVMVGSSRMQNHVNTSTFSTRGHQTFNFGVPGRFMADYPYMVKASTAAGARQVVLGIPASQLYSAPGCPREWRKADVVFYLEHNPTCLREIVGKRLIELSNANSLFSTYDESLIYHPCTAIPANTSDALLLQVRGYCGGTRGVTFARSRQQVNVVGFSTGDAEIVYRNETRWGQLKNSSDFSKSTFNSEAIDQLRNLVALVRAGGAEPIIIIEPEPVDKVIIDEGLHELLDTRVIYLTSIDFKDNEISDRLHLSAAGNARFTDILYSKLFPTERPGAEGQ